RVTAAGADGRYALTDVPPGPQHVTVRFIGYEPRVLHALVPNGGTLEINLTLRPVPIRLRTIEVRPKVAVRGLEGDDTPYRRCSSPSVPRGWRSLRRGRRCRAGPPPSWPA
ncbi:MAG: carboxypeptidase regulatory-like domain-containing protein, partial [Gemmatimonadales bacterium]|nr:carboxypeptidase regulatory-like domain-containing protein [Gemmatimonadales bacterium]